MTISVCMGTYNGEKYIEEQMYSILHQTRKPDEVIICDDASGDRTVEIIRRFIRDNHLEECWKLYENAENRGYPANFYYAMNLCSGDLVFLSDQDDIWHEKKLEQMCNVLDRHPKTKALSCKFGLIDANGSNLRTIMAPTHNKDTGNLRKVTVDAVFYKGEWPGMVLAYRNEWYRTRVETQVEPQVKAQMKTPASGTALKIPHDLLICARAAEEQGFLQIDEELAYHRRHENNAGGEEHRIGKLLSKSRKVKEIKDYLQILECFQQEKVLQTEVGKLALEKKYQTMKDRYEALQSGKISKVISNAGKHKENVRLATVLCDVVIVKRRK